MTYICAKQNSSFTADHCSDASARALNLISAVLGTVIAVSIIICLAAAVVAVRLAAVRVCVCAAVIVLVLIVLKKHTVLYDRTEINLVDWGCKITA